MGLFTKTIPQRKWVDVLATLHNSTKSYRASWFKHFVDHVAPLNIGLRRRELTPEIEGTIGILQFAVAATTAREYVKLKDFDSFIDLICISITSKKTAELDSKSVELMAPRPRSAPNDENVARAGIKRWAVALICVIFATL
jgi:hypothetical protein